MFELVPSLYMRSLFKDLNFELSDFNKATLIWNNLLHDRNEKLCALKNLLESTSDECLKQQIQERLDYEDDMLRTMKNNNDGDPISGITCSADGNIKGIWSNEMSEETESIVDPYRTDRFEHQFFRIPFEGTIGWPVRDITDGTIGVLMQDTKGWQKYMDRSIYRDYSDIQVEVVFLTPYGCWSHEHINPIYLELDHPLGESAKSLAMGRAMEFLCEYLIRFEKGVETKWYDEQALAAAREYRDLCFKEMIEEEKKKNGIVDRAKTIEELII